MVNLRSCGRIKESVVLEPCREASCKNAEENAFISQNGREWERLLVNRRVQ